MESSVAVLPDALGLGVDVNWDPRDPEGGKDWWFVARVHRGERIVFRLWSPFGNLLCSQGWT